MKTKGDDDFSLEMEGPFVRLFLDHYLLDKAGGTRKIYFRWLTEFIKFCCERWNCGPSEIDFGRCTIYQIGEHPLYDQIRPEVVKSFLEGLASRTCRAQARTVLRNYFTYLLEQDIVHVNPVPKTTVRHVPAPKQGPTLKEIKSLARSILEAQEPYRSAFIIQLSAGLRVGELQCLRADDVIRDKDSTWSLTICREAMKGRTEWKLPLPQISDVISSLMAWREIHGIQSEYLFTYKNGKPIPPRTFRTHLKKLTSNPNFNRPLVTHDLRRAYATLMNEYIKNPDVLVHAMRHKSDLGGGDIVTRGYVRKPGHEDVVAWVEALPVVRLVDSIAALWFGAEL